METHITISEVGPRDGLQSIQTIMPSEKKMAWIKALHAAGLSEIEVGSFVPKIILPQMADTADLVKFASKLEGLVVAVLAPNLHGVRAAAESGAHKISIPLSMSETHSIKNVNKTHAQMLEEIRNCVKYLKTIPKGRRPKFEVGLSTAFGCTIEGAIPRSKVISLAEEVINYGVDEVGLSDTTGFGNPKQLKDLVEGVWERCGRDSLTGVHLHNTRGLGLANALMAVEIGISTIDSSLGGIGGCPWAPGATGNIVTEDLVFLLESMGYNTGVDIEALLIAREVVHRALPQEALYGYMPSVGLPKGWKTVSSSP